MPPRELPPFVGALELSALVVGLLCVLAGLASALRATVVHRGGRASGHGLGRRAFGAVLVGGTAFILFLVLIAVDASWDGANRPASFGNDVWRSAVAVALLAGSATTGYRALAGPRWLGRAYLLLCALVVTAFALIT